jgi:hypothetical protein
MRNCNAANLTVRPGLVFNWTPCTVDSKMDMYGFNSVLGSFSVDTSNPQLRYKYKYIQYIILNVRTDYSDREALSVAGL